MKKSIKLALLFSGSLVAFSAQADPASSAAANVAAKVAEEIVVRILKEEVEKIGKKLEKRFEQRIKQLEVMFVGLLQRSSQMIYDKSKGIASGVVSKTKSRLGSWRDKLLRRKPQQEIEYLDNSNIEPFYNGMDDEREFVNSNDSSAIDAYLNDVIDPAHNQ